MAPRSQTWRDVTRPAVKQCCITTKPLGFHRDIIGGGRGGDSQEIKTCNAKGLEEEHSNVVIHDMED